MITNKAWTFGTENLNATGQYGRGTYSRLVFPRPIYGGKQMGLATERLGKAKPRAPEASGKQDVDKTRAQQIRAYQVRDRDELEAAFRLVHDNYVRSGYMEPHPAGIRIGVYNALPTTTTFVALAGDEVTATVSLFLDSAMGLPLDSLYGDVADSLRAQGRKIGEVGMLADRRRNLSEGIHLLLELMKLVSLTARGRDLDDLLITVNPKHEKFYERLLRFKKFGQVREYQAVKNAPAVLLRIQKSDLESQETRNEQVHEVFFSPVTGSNNTPGYRMRREDLAYFFLDKTDVFNKLDRDQTQAIEECFPGLKTSELLATAAMWRDPVGRKTA